MSRRLLPLVLLLSALALPAHAAPAAFVDALELDPLRRLAVQQGGRLATFDTLARETLRQAGATGRDEPVVTYLDLTLTPTGDAAERTIVLRKSATRRALAAALRRAVPAEARVGALSEEVLGAIERDGRVPLRLLELPAVEGALSELGSDLLRGAREVERLRTARSLTDPATLAARLRVVPPPGGDAQARWYALTELAEVPGLAPAQRQALATAWAVLGEGWRRADARAVNEAARVLAAELPKVAPRVYPSEARLDWELRYHRARKLTWTWLVYFLALPFLLMSVVYGFRWAHRTGLALFAAGLALHTAAVAMRWYLSGRIPNANMFEAVTASAWLGGLLALPLEAALRARRMRGLPALAAAAYATLAMMMGHFLPTTLDSAIRPVAPLLDRTVWLYVHTNLVIVSYALIAFAAVTALVYLLLRLAARLAPAGRLAQRWRGAAGPLGALGGAADLVLQRPDERPGLARTLDGATMVFLELAFVTLWLGTLLGAVWADASWGRPWGWDPKEVFALNTWLVFLVLLHLRLRVRDKGLWTALLALGGFAVMLFNWLAVNFVIVGLHSYA